MNKKALILAAALVVTFVPSAEAATALDVRKCIAALLRTLGTTAKCRYKVEAKFLIKADTAQRALDAEKCATKAFEKRDKIVAKYGDACPSAGEPVAALGAPETLMTRVAGLLVSPALAQGSSYQIQENSIGRVVAELVGNGVALQTAGLMAADTQPFKLRVDGLALPRPEPTTDLHVETTTILRTYTDLGSRLDTSLLSCVRRSRRAKPRPRQRLRTDRGRIDGHRHGDQARVGAQDTWERRARSDLPGDVSGRLLGFPSRPLSHKCGVRRIG
jgi:hypothetical protein